jgi:hypothetical protein
MVEQTHSDLYETNAGVVSEHWKTHVKLCMQKQGWGEKAVD